MIVTNQARNYSILKQNSAIMYIFRIFNNEMTIILHSDCHCWLQVFLFCHFSKPYRQKKSRFQPAGYGVRRPWNACATAAVHHTLRPSSYGYGGRRTTGVCMFQAQ